MMKNQIANIMGFAHMAKHNAGSNTTTSTQATKRRMLFLRYTRMQELWSSESRMKDSTPTSRRENYMNYVQEQKRNEPRSFMISTVDENKFFYSQRQYERAKEARKLYHIIGRPSLENFKHILMQKIIKNCPVTPEDVDIAEKIFGKDVATLKGKSKNPRPLPVIYDNVEIPPEIKEQHRNLKLCLDMMFVNQLPFLTSIDSTIKFRSCVPLNNQKAEEIYRALDDVL